MGFSELFEWFEIHSKVLFSGYSVLISVPLGAVMQKENSFRTFWVVFLSVIFLFLAILSEGFENFMPYLGAVIFVVTAMYFIESKKSVVSRKSLDRLIRKFTETANHNDEICIFGGDLDFFGKVLNNNIAKNKQYCQIKDMEFKKIKILCIKPEETKKRDKETKLRIGFLIDNFGDDVKIKFFENKRCKTCSEKENCFICPDNKNKCDKLEECSFAMCYNPDPGLRGRIIRTKKDGSVSVAIVSTQVPGKSYLLKEHSSGTKECTIYQNIWNMWWENCKSDDKFTELCKEEYINSKNQKGDNE